MESDIETKQGLKEKYYNPATGYESAERLYKKMFEEGLDVSRKSKGMAKDAVYLHPVQADSKQAQLPSDVH